MSLYEALDNFVGAGVLACAGMVGAEMPHGQLLDGSAFSRQLRAQRLGEAFGGALDALAHAIWMVQEQRGFSHSVSEAHALTLGRLLSVVRLDRQDLIGALASESPASGTSAVGGHYGVGSRIADTWIAKATARGVLPQPGLVDDVVRFLLGRMFSEVVEQPQLMEEMRDALVAFRDAIMGGGVTYHAPIPALQPEIMALNSAADALRSADTSGLIAKPAKLPAALLSVAPLPNMPAGALKRFQSILAGQPLNEKQQLSRLAELGIWLSSTVEHLRRPTNEGADLQRIKGEAASALEAGNLELAMDLLKAVREHFREDRRGTERRIAEELENLRLSMLEEAAATARLGELAMARFDFAAAADFFADAAIQLPAKETALEFDYRQRHAEALAGRSEEKPEARGLEAAAQAFRTCRRLLVRDRDPASWVRTSVGLGDMLTALAKHSPQPDISLQEAVVSFAEAVEVVDRAVKPMQWALIQLSHASALVDLGEITDRERHWKHAATVVVPALDIFESRGATDLASAAREKLRMIASSLDADSAAAAQQTAG